MRLPNEKALLKAPDEHWEATGSSAPDGVRAAAKAMRKRREDRFDTLMEVLGETVHMGVSQSGSPKWSSNSDRDAIAAVFDACQWLPRRWLRASSNLERQRDRALGLPRGETQASIDTRGGRYRDEQDPPEIVINPRGERPGTSEAKTQLRLTAYHELGHRMEHAVPGVRAIIEQFFKRRTAGQPFILDERGIGPDRRTVKFYHKAFYDYYAGREPAQGNLVRDKQHPEVPWEYYEILSTGLEGLKDLDIDLLYLDEEHACLVLGLMVAR